MTNWRIGCVREYQQSCPNASLHWLQVIFCSTREEEIVEWPNGDIGRVGLQEPVASLEFAAVSSNGN